MFFQAVFRKKCRTPQKIDTCPQPKTNREQYIGSPSFFSIQPLLYNPTIRHLLCFKLLQNRNKKGNMETKTRSLRNIEHCNQIKNIFHRRDGTKELLSIIPEAIAKQISSTQSISCSFVDKLQEFTAETDIQDELSFAANAALFQSQWIKAIQANNIVGQQPHQGLQIVKNQSYYALPKATAISGRQGHNKLEIWQNSQFLQRLNDFIMGEPSELKYFQPQDNLLER